MVFLLKKWLGLLLMPLPLASLLLIFGLFLLWLTKKQTAGKICVTIATILLLSFSIRPSSIFLNRPLEQKFPPFQSAKTIDYIIVLGHGHVSDPTIPLNSQLSEAAMARVTEGMRIKKMYPAAKMIFSGSVLGDPISGAEMYARVAEQAGIPRSDMLLIENAKDTEEEVKADKVIIKDKTAALVTSASHMPRAMNLFIKEGVAVIPAPTQYVGRIPQSELPIYSYLPAGRYLMYSEMALHEWVGEVWNSIRD